MFTFIETKLFSRLADEYLSDDQLRGLQQHLSENPEAGDISASLVALGSYAGVQVVEGNEAGF